MKLLLLTAKLTRVIRNQIVPEGDREEDTPKGHKPQALPSKHTLSCITHLAYFSQEAIIFPNSYVSKGYGSALSKNMDQRLPLSPRKNAERGDCRKSNKSHLNNGQCRGEEVRAGHILKAREKWEMRLLAITCS